MREPQVGDCVRTRSEQVDNDPLVGTVGWVERFSEGGLIIVRFLVTTPTTETFYFTHELEIVE